MDCKQNENSLRAQLFEIKYEPVRFLVYIQQQCSGMLSHGEQAEKKNIWLHNFIPLWHHPLPTTCWFESNKHIDAYQHTLGAITPLSPRHLAACTAHSWPRAGEQGLEELQEAAAPPASRPGRIHQ